MDSAIPNAISLLQIASLWSIRLAMVCLVAGLALELKGIRRTDSRVVLIWLLGALFAFGHSLGALASFHHFSHAEAVKSTADQTEAMLGIRVGAGLYVNYVFVAVWLWDACVRTISPAAYNRLPKIYTWLVYSFLIFIAINGAIVFKSGTIRVLGIVCVIGLLLLFRQRCKCAPN